MLRLLLAAGILLSVGLPVSAQYVFGRYDFVAGDSPRAIAAADVDGDGKIDIAVIDVTQRTVAVFLGKPDGTFGTKTVLATGRTPLSLTIADFNRDRKPDIAVSNDDENTVSILLGNGDGTFQPRVDYPVGDAPAQIIAVDVNGDRNLDLVTGNRSLSVSVLLGNGDGSFQRNVDFPTAVGAGLGPVGAVASGDFNGDGRLDLAVPVGNTNMVAVLLGNGDGTFRSFVEYPTGVGPSWVACGDFNGDGRLDLAVTNRGPSNGVLANSVSILLGNGDGTFRAHVDRPVGPDPSEIIAADVDRDGRLDLITANANCETSPCGFGSISVLLGNGDGTFRAHRDFGTGLAPTIAVTEVNGDGAADVAVAHRNCRFFPCGPGSVSILLGNGDGSFSGTDEYATERNPSSVTAADFRRVGILDLIVVNQFADTISYLRGDGHGAFQQQTVLVSGLASIDAAAVDVNGDGNADVVTANGTNTVSVLLGNGNGTFRPHVDYVTGSGPAVVLARDINGDGKLDLAVLNAGSGFGNSVSILLGNGDGTFKARTDSPAGPFANWMAAGDFNGDGKPDLAVSNAGGGAGPLSILLGNGNGTLQAPVAYEAAAFPCCIASGDLNGDGKLDLAIPTSGNTAGPVAVLLGNGDGTFRKPVGYATGFGAGQLIIADLNGDHRLDLAVISSQVNGVSILLGNGDGTFQDHVDFATGTQPLALTAADLDGDGGLDLAVTAAFPDESVAVLRNRPFIALSATRMHFVARAAGIRSAVQTLLVSNVGAAPFSISGISASGEFAQTNTCPPILPPGSSCSVSVTFLPSSIAARVGSLTIMDGAQNSPHTVLLSGVSGRQRAVSH